MAPLCRNALAAMVAFVALLGCSSAGTGKTNPASQPLRQGMMKKFRAADTDGNGLLSRDEVQKNVPRLTKHFDEIDNNHDDQLSPEEIGAYLKARWHFH